jgi:hypothetical protein
LDESGIRVWAHEVDQFQVRLNYIANLSTQIPLLLIFSALIENEN